MAFAIVTIAGCTQDVSEPIVDHQMTVSRADQLRVTTDYIFTDEQFDNAEFEQKVSGGLNRWLEKQVAEFGALEWSVDELIATLPEQVRQETKSLDSTSFVTTDTHYIQGQMWVRELTPVISARPLARTFWPPLAEQLPEGPLAEGWQAAFAAAYPELSEEDRARLLTACKLFDWTTLNIQLTARRPWPGRDEVEAQRLIETDSSWPPAAGVRGPGYNRFAWQTLLFGHGDDLERARVFLLLASEAGLPGVLLAIRSDDEAAVNPLGYRVWLPAVLIGGELYLFDTAMGLPLPAEDPRRIATLSAVVQNPDVLRALDLSPEESTSDDADYRVRPEDLGRGIAALVETPTESLTRRMALLERGLTGDERLRLTSAPSQLAAAVRDLPGISEVKLSPLDWCTQQFRAAVKEGERAGQFNADIRERLIWQVLEEEYVNSYVRFRKARNKYFRNNLVSQRGVLERGAIEWFQLMRYSDDFINTLHENTNVLDALGIASHLPAGEYNRRLNNTKEHMRLVRADATYCLALTHLVTGNPSVAATWLDRVDEFDRRNYWEVGVRYLTGRCHEALEELDEAIKVYQTGKDDRQLTPQTFGNLIRARLLQPLADSGP